MTNVSVCVYLAAWITSVSPGCADSWMSMLKISHSTRTISRSGQEPKTLSAANTKSNRFVEDSIVDKLAYFSGKLGNDGQ